MAADLLLLRRIAGIAFEAGRLGDAAGQSDFALVEALAVLAGQDQSFVLRVDGRRRHVDRIVDHDEVGDLYELPDLAGAPEGRRKKAAPAPDRRIRRSEEHTSELQSLMRNSYAVFCLKNNIHQQ